MNIYFNIYRQQLQPALWYNIYYYEVTILSRFGKWVLTVDTADLVADYKKTTKTAALSVSQKGSEKEEKKTHSFKSTLRIE